MLNRIHIIGAVFAVAIFNVWTFGSDDGIKVITKKMPAVTAASEDIPSNCKYADMMKKWGIGAWWKQEKYSDSTYLGHYRNIPLYSTSWVTVSNGFEAAICTPEMIAGITKDKAKSKLLDAQQTRTLYQSNLVNLGGDNLAFVGYLQLNADTYTLSAINDKWTVLLITENGKRIEPKQIDITAAYSYDLGMGRNAWRRDFTVMFDNTDKQLMSDSTRSLILAAGSEAGQIKAKYEFRKRSK